MLEGQWQNGRYIHQVLSMSDNLNFIIDLIKHCSLGLNYFNIFEKHVIVSKVILQSMFTVMLSARITFLCMHARKLGAALNGCAHVHM